MKVAASVNEVDQRGLHWLSAAAGKRFGAGVVSYGGEARLQPDGPRESSLNEPMTYDGGCTCRHVRYRCTTAPMIVHCCHCRWCQRETGSAFVLNALIETDRMELLEGEVDVVHTPSHSGKGQEIARCPRCRVALWSNYPQSGPAVRFVRVGTLDEPDRWPPEIHIYTSSKQPWVVIPEDMRSVPEFYDPREVWPAGTMERFVQARARAPAKP